jgi:flagellar motor switch protein FliM
VPLLTTSEPVVPCDFRRPAWISAERRTVLDGVHARLAPAFAHAISSLLRLPVEVAVSEAGQRTFADWRSEQSRPCVGFVSALEEGGAPEAAWMFTPSLARRVVDRQLGGRGGIAADPAPLTMLEQAVLDVVVRELWRVLAAGYRDVARLAPGAARFEDTPASLRFQGDYDRAYVLTLAVTLDTKGGGDPEPLAVCLPARRLEAFLRGLPLDAPPDVVTAGPPPRALIEAHLRAARIPLVACLPGFQLAARDGAALRVGDLLETPQTFEGAVELHALGHRLFHATLGRQQGHVGLRLHEPLRTPPAPPRLLRRTTSR